MSFRIRGLDPESFRHLYGASAAELAAHLAERQVADAAPGFPDRIRLTDASPGETLLLVNHLHQPAANPYRASHAVYVREGALEPYDGIDAIPPSLAIRPLSLRAFDASDRIVDARLVDARLVDGAEAAGAIEELFRDPRALYLHAHFARFGCYAARIERA